MLREDYEAIYGKGIFSISVVYNDVCVHHVSGESIIHTVLRLCRKQCVDWMSLWVSYSPGVYSLSDHASPESVEVAEIERLTGEGLSPLTCSVNFALKGPLVPLVYNEQKGTLTVRNVEIGINVSDVALSSIVRDCGYEVRVREDGLSGVNAIRRKVRTTFPSKLWSSPDTTMTCSYETALSMAMESQSSICLEGESNVITIYDNCSGNYIALVLAIDEDPRPELVLDEDITKISQLASRGGVTSSYTNCRISRPMVIRVKSAREYKKKVGYVTVHYVKEDYHFEVEDNSDFVSTLRDAQKPRSDVVVEISDWTFKLMGEYVSFLEKIGLRFSVSRDGPQIGHVDELSHYLVSTGAVKPALLNGTDETVTTAKNLIGSLIEGSGEIGGVYVKSDVRGVIIGLFAESPPDEALNILCKPSDEGHLQNLGYPHYSVGLTQFYTTNESHILSSNKVCTFLPCPLGFNYVSLDALERCGSKASVSGILTAVRTGVTVLPPGARVDTFGFNLDKALVKEYGFPDTKWSLQYLHQRRADIMSALSEYLGSEEVYTTIPVDRFGVKASEGVAVPDKSSNRCGYSGCMCVVAPPFSGKTSVASSLDWVSEIEEDSDYEALKSSYLKHGPSFEFWKELDSFDSKTREKVKKSNSPVILVWRKEHVPDGYNSKCVSLQQSVYDDHIAASDDEFRKAFHEICQYDGKVIGPSLKDYLVANKTRLTAFKTTRQPIKWRFIAGVAAVMLISSVIVPTAMSFRPRSTAKVSGSFKQVLVNSTEDAFREAFKSYVSDFEELYFDNSSKLKLMLRQPGSKDKVLFKVGGKRAMSLSKAIRMLEGIIERDLIAPDSIAVTHDSTTTSTTDDTTQQIDSDSYPSPSTTEEPPTTTTTKEDPVTTTADEPTGSTPAAVDNDDEDDDDFWNRVLGG